MYEEYKIYGPYTRKDRRLFLILRKDLKNKTISYPKYLMECFLGRKLLPNEDVHHIDGNFLNNEISNLKVINHSVHCREHSLKYRKSLNVICGFCGKEFTITPIQQRTKTQNLTKGKSKYYFCSRTCSGKYGKSIQVGTFV